MNLLLKKTLGPRSIYSNKIRCPEYEVTGMTWGPNFDRSPLIFLTSSMPQPSQSGLTRNPPPFQLFYGVRNTLSLFKDIFPAILVIEVAVVAHIGTI